MEPHQLNDLFGNIDLYLLDQILKNRFSKNGRILDAGCGEGRNVHYFLKQNLPVYGVDINKDSIRMCRMVVKGLNSEYVENFIESNLEKLPFPDGFFNSVICCSVLHFAQDQQKFKSMVQELDRVTCEGGFLFIRMVDQPVVGIPFWLNKSMTHPWEEMGYSLLEPLKSVIQNEQSLNVMVLEKGHKKRA